MRNWGKTLALLLVVLFLASLVTVSSAVSVHATLSWNVQTVNDEDAWVGGYCPIAVDSNNTAHIAYMAFPNRTNSLIYASYNGSEWTNQTVPTGQVQVVFSLVLDANNNPHILYDTSPLGAPINPLIIATWNGRNWEIQDTGITYASYATLALDSFGNPHIAYTAGITLKYGDNWVGNALKYASWTGTGWNIQTIDTNMTDSYSTVSLVLDSNNTPYILYSLSSNSSSIKLATYQNLNWKIQAAQLPPSTGNCGNIVVDSKGYPHFICTQPYQNSTTLSTILYVSFNLTTWNTQTIASRVNLGTISSLVLDSQDYAHFCYTTLDKGLMYAAYSGSAWNIQTVHSNVPIFGEFDLGVAGPFYVALDTNGNPHISYRAGTPIRYTAFLMYATATETTLTPSPASPTVSEPTILTVAAVAIIASVVVVAYVWKKKIRKNH